MTIDSLTWKTETGTHNDNYTDREAKGDSAGSKESGGLANNYTEDYVQDSDEQRRAVIGEKSHPFTRSIRVLNLCQLV